MGIIKIAWVKWDLILASHEKGGLGIGSLNSFNLSLLLKWRWRLVNNPNALWVRVIKEIHGPESGFAGPGCYTKGLWYDIVSFITMRQSQNVIDLNTLTRVIGNGMSTRFWQDVWIGNESLATRFNCLYRLDTRPNRTISDRFNSSSFSWEWLRNPPLSCNLHQLVSDLASVHLRSADDSWQWNLEPDGV
ncbi:uncharacterized mitochondrial protein AtMg00310-like [Rutidosis leptorrhynchoides]|uniref:uncharacterized mitochondrial protein AtMg00310-like n=1 Tax=Rutidosis leptorrhynchoides TaxID=125765 RepID=UPI003A99DDA5